MDLRTLMLSCSLIASVTSLHLGPGPHSHNELDKDEEHLLRSAYEYEHGGYDYGHPAGHGYDYGHPAGHGYEHPTGYDYGHHYEPDLLSFKKDLLKDAAWAFKAKVHELKMMDLALKANLLKDKLKVDEFLKLKLHQLAHKKDKDKYDYGHGGYEAPSYGHDPYYGH